MSSLPFGEALAHVVDSLQRLGVPYFVGGSVATVLHGEIRTTQDIDIVVELQPAQVAPLTASLSPHFFVDEQFLRDAVLRRSSCNLIHRDSGFKVDFFLLRDRPFSRMEMQRRRSLELVPGLALNIASAEDCVLTKLEWFEKGGRVPDRQWRDVLGMLKGQRGALDLTYLRQWAGELAIEELLERALREAGTTQG